MTRVCLDNATCVYCHKPFDAVTRPEEEHVIGRKFVPKVSLAAQNNAAGGENGKFFQDATRQTSRNTIKAVARDCGQLAVGRRITNRSAVELKVEMR